jgi:hypothetical protein
VVLHQRPDGDRHDARGPALSRRERAAPGAVRPPGCGELDAGDDRAGLRHRPLRGRRPRALRRLLRPHPVPRRDDGLLVLHHPIPPRRPRLHAA